MPLTLTLLSEAVPAGKRGARARHLVGRLAASASRSARWSAAPSSTGISWHWIFWLNVPIGLALAAAGAPPADRVLRPVAVARPPGPRARRPRPARRWSTGSCAATRWAGRAPTILGSLGAGAALLAAFVAWELRAPAPMLPMRFFRSRAFAATNGVSLAMYFGVFGSIFLLAQFFQVVQGYSPLEAGLRTLPWTGDADARRAARRASCRDRIGSRPLMATGLALQAVAIGWLAVGLDPDRALRRPGRRRSSWPAPAWRSSSRPPPTPCSARCARRRPARPRARRTRSARSAACSASPCWPACSPPRLLRLAAGVHGRPDERDLGRRRRAGRRRAGRAAGPGRGTHARRGAGPGGRRGRPARGGPARAGCASELGVERLDVREDRVGDGLLLVAGRRSGRARRRPRRRRARVTLRELQPPPVAHVGGAVDRHRDDRRAALAARGGRCRGVRASRQRRRCASARPPRTCTRSRRASAPRRAVTNASSSAKPRRTGNTPPCV